MGRRTSQGRILTSLTLIGLTTALLAVAPTSERRSAAPSDPTPAAAPPLESTPIAFDTLGLVALQQP